MTSSGTIFFFIFLHLIPSTYSTASKQSIPTVTNPILGTIHGAYINSTSNHTSEQFLGMPYATPPIGKLRFSPASLWTTTYPNTSPFNSFGADCWQGGKGYAPDPSHTSQSEDCLTINVWRPTGTTASSKLSVMVWIYGGGFQGGSGAVRWWNGAALAANENVIVVSLNYRVGALGFLASNELAQEGLGNGGLNGIHDQIVALKWVQKYIEDFGGDSQSVTIFGQSAGGESVCVLTLSPPAKKLFQRAIIQSGPCAFSYWSPQNNSYALELGRMVMEENNVSSIAELRKLPVDKITWPDGPSESQFFNGYFAPDGYVLLQTPQELLINNATGDDAVDVDVNAVVINPIDILIGTTSMDGTLTFVYDSLPVPIHHWNYEYNMQTLYSERAEAVLAQYPLSRFKTETYNGASYGYVRSDADRALICPTIKLAKTFAQKLETVGSVYHYVFEYGSQISTCDIVHTSNPIVPRNENVYWASHGTENRLIFGTEYGPDISPTALTKHCSLKKDLVLSKQMGHFWSSFAKTGVPLDVDGVMDWPSVSGVNGDMSSMKIGGNTSVVKNYRRDDCEFWESVVHV